MSQGLSFDQMQQVQHVACMAVLAMCARGVADTEFECTPEVTSVRITVNRSGDALPSSVDVEFVNSTGFPVGGLSL